MIKSAIQGVLQRLFILFPTKLLLLLERMSQSAQGKGWDGGIDNEIYTLLSLMDPIGMDQIIAIDVGANTGSWTSALINRIPGAEVHAFEPSSASFEILSKNLADFPNVTLYQTALGLESGKATLYADFATSGLASLSKRKLENIEFAYVEDISITTLDQWQRVNNNVRPNVLKIDVEGHEFEVLKGGTHLLSSVKVIQFEFGGTDIDTRTFLQDFWYFFLDAGFKIFRLGPKGLIEIKRYSERDEMFVFTTFYAIKK